MSGACTSVKQKGDGKQESCKCSLVDEMLSQPRQLQRAALPGTGEMCSQTWMLTLSSGHEHTVPTTFQQVGTSYSETIVGQRLPKVTRDQSPRAGGKHLSY